jgi:hypothetical protein
MKFEIHNFTDNVTDFMRSAGYHYDGSDQKTKEMRFYKTLSSNLYPRFHIYGFWDKTAQKLLFNLHLDQKAPVYQGASAHSGDYEGPVVEKEAARIQDFYFEKKAPKMTLDL